MPALRIQVGASVHRSVQDVFKNIADIARKCRADLKAISSGQADDEIAAAKRGAAGVTAAHELTFAGRRKLRQRMERLEAKFDRDELNAKKARLARLREVEKTFDSEQNAALAKLQGVAGRRALIEKEQAALHKKMAVQRARDASESARLDAAAEAAGNAAKAKTRGDDVMMMKASHREVARLRREERTQRSLLAGWDETVRAEEEARRRKKATDRVGALSNVGILAGAGLAGAGIVGGVVGSVAMGIARGAGVQVDTASLTSSYVERDKLAADISNSGYFEGAPGQRGIRQSPRTLMDEATTVGMATATNPTTILRGLQDFVKVTSDLENGRKLMLEIGKLARATGTDFNQLTMAAGNFAKTLENSPDKVGDTMKILYGLGGGGKLGAVELSDSAIQGPKLASAAAQLTGTDRVGAAMQIAALAQFARGEGGAISASQAANSAMGYVNIMKTPARMAQFKKYTNHSTYGADGGILLPRDAMLMALQGTKGDIKELKEIFANIIGERSMTGLKLAYNRAGGGAAGTAAYNKKWDEQTKDIFLSLVERSDSFAVSMERAEAKATLFQNKMQKLADDVLPTLIDRLVVIAPELEKFAKSTGDVALWLSDNLGSAIVLAAGASIAQAGIGLAIKTMLVAYIEGAAITSAMTAATSSVAALGAAAGLTALAMVGVAALIDKYFGGKVTEQKNHLRDEFAASTAESGYRQGLVTPQQLGVALSPIEARRQAIEDELKNNVSANNYVGADGHISNYTHVPDDQFNSDSVNLMLDELKRLVEISRIGNDLLKVKNFGIGPDGVSRPLPPAARVGPDTRPFLGMVDSERR